MIGLRLYITNGGGAEFLHNSISVDGREQEKVYKTITI